MKERRDITRKRTSTGHALTKTRLGQKAIPAAAVEFLPVMTVWSRDAAGHKVEVAFGNLNSCVRKLPQYSETCIPKLPKVYLESHEHVQSGLVFGNFRRHGFGTPPFHAWAHLCLVGRLVPLPTSAGGVVGFLIPGAWTPRVPKYAVELALACMAWSLGLGSCSKQQPST